MFYGILSALFLAIEAILLSLALVEMTDILTTTLIILAPLSIALINNIFSFSILFITMCISGKIIQFFKKMEKRKTLLLFISSILGGPLGMFGYILALHNLGVIAGAVSTVIYPAVGAVFAHIFTKERMDKYQMFFFVLTLMGISEIQWLTQVEVINYTYGLIGVAMCSIGWGSESVILSKLLYQNEDENVEDILLMVQFNCSIIYIIIATLFYNCWNFTTIFHENNINVFVLMGFAAFFGIISYLFYYSAIKSIGAMKSLCLTATSFAWVVMFGMVIYHKLDCFTVENIGVICMIFVCSFLASYHPKDKEE